MSEQTSNPAEKDHGWYKYGVAFLVTEMVIAVAVCVYSLSMAFTGTGGFPGKG